MHGMVAHPGLGDRLHKMPHGCEDPAFPKQCCENLVKTSEISNWKVM